MLEGKIFIKFCSYEGNMKTMLEQEVIVATVGNGWKGERILALKCITLDQISPLHAPVRGGGDRSLPSGISPSTRSREQIFGCSLQLLVRVD